MDMNNVIVAGGAAYRLRVTVCGNDEVLGQDLGFPDMTFREDRQEIGTMAVKAASGALDKFGLDYRVDCCFANWRGGKFCNPLDLGRFPVFALAYRLDWDEESQSWDEGDRATSSAVLQNIMDTLMSVVRAAVDKAMAEGVEAYSQIETETED